MVPVVLVSRWLLGLAATLAGAVGVTACGTASGAAGVAPGTVSIVAAENEYGNVAAQIGGRYVHVTSVQSNPNVDPHAYELSPRVAAEVARARLVIQNGLGYDDFMTRIESGSPDAGRRQITVAHLLGLAASTPNPHLWYSPRTMPAVARAIGADLAALDPGHAASFRANVARFDASLKPWYAAIAAFRSRYAGTRAATTEPVADDLLAAMGIDNLTPFVLQADVMNGTDPTPQDLAMVSGLLARHQVRVFAYNRQVVDSLTRSVRDDAQRAGIPVVGVYETMPAPGYTYQSWMLAETRAVRAAVLHGTSTRRL